MDVREKLVELIENANYLCDNRDCDEDAEGCAYHCYANCWAQFIVDHLIANGVTINVGTADAPVADNLSPTEPLTHCQQWIPVTERLPSEADGTVLVCHADKAPYNYTEPFANAKHDCRVVVGSYSEYSGKWYCNMGGTLHDVTHWMPQPEPPKGE